VRVPDDEYRCETGLAELADIANATRPLPQAFLSATGTGVTEAFRAYALPLLGAPLPRYAGLGAAPHAW